MRPTVLRIAVLISGLLPAAAYGQTAAASPTVRDVPFVTVTLGSMSDWLENSGFFGAPAIMGTVQLPLSRYLVLEGEVTRRVVRDSFSFFSGPRPGVNAETQTRTAENRSVGVGANLLVRAGTPRFIGFAGGGLRVERSKSGLTTSCQPLAAGVCTPSPGQPTSLRTGLAAQALGGVDIVLTRRASIFTGIRVATDFDNGATLGAVAGMRVAVRMHPEPARIPPPLTLGSAGGRVTVTLTDGRRRSGRLVSLSAYDVVIGDNGQNVVLPFAGVRAVQRVSHQTRTGALIGAGVAGVIAILAATDPCTGDDCGAIPAYVALFSAASIGTGAGLGALSSAASAERRLLYLSPNGSTVRVAPVLAPGRAGVNVAMRW